MSLQTMEIVGAQYPSKVWGPTSLELRRFTLNHPKESMDKIQNTIDHQMSAQMPMQDSSLHTIMLKLTKKGNIRLNHRQSIDYMAEDAVHICALLKRDGYLNMDNKIPCEICTVEQLEQNMLRQIHKDFEISKQVRHCLVQLDDVNVTKMKYKQKQYCPVESGVQICSNEYQSYAQQQFPPPKKPVLQARNIFIIPNGENPAEYMALFFDWFQYLNNFQGSLYIRLPYTNNFKF